MRPFYFSFLFYFSFILGNFLGNFLGSLAIAKEVPPLTSPVMDMAGLLSQGQRDQLSAALFRLKENGGPQFQVLIIESLEDEVLENYSIKVTDKWKLGDEKKDNGALFLIALKERKMRIEVGQGLEGDLTDLKTSRIIDEVRSYFKQENYAEGIALALDTMAKETGHPKIFEGTHTFKKRKSRVMSLGNIFLLGLFIVLAVLFRILSMFERPTGMHRYGRGGMYGGMSSRGGWSSRGGGGGGSWGGGGGGFSGGGSSGSW